MGAPSPMPSATANSPAGLDVMADEPVNDSPLFDLASVVVTPHVACYSEESLAESRRKAAENVVRVLQGDESHGLVNERTLPT